jgi:hypothetical protein
MSERRRDPVEADPSLLEVLRGSGVTRGNRDDGLDLARRKGNASAPDRHAKTFFGRENHGEVGLVDLADLPGPGFVHQVLEFFF